MGTARGSEAGFGLQTHGEARMEEISCPRQIGQEKIIMANAYYVSHSIVHVKMIAYRIQGNLFIIIYI